MQRRRGVRERWAVCALVLCVFVCALARAQTVSPSSLQDALRGTGVAAMVLDVGSGRVLAQVGDVTALAAPGSTVKPFVLRTALESGAINEHTTVHCAGMLRVAGHNLACVHPRDVTVPDARQALAESCNTYFAAVGQRMSAEQVEHALLAAGFRVHAPPADMDQRELMVLGLFGVQGSVQQMADAYRGLALWMARTEPAARVVRDGLVTSVNTGVAHAAFVPGLTVAGKTGTVDVPGTGRSHGWFAGVVYGAGEQPERVIVVFVPSGNGRDAAALARRLLMGRR